MTMIFSHINRNIYFIRHLIKRPVYICLLLLLFSVASIIAQKFELIFIEQLEKQIYKDKISTTAESMSYAYLYGGNIWGGQVHGYHQGRSASDWELFLIVSPIEQGNNEINFLVTVIEPDRNDLSENAFKRPVDTETELTGNLLTPEEKLSLIALLNTLADGPESNQP